VQSPQLTLSSLGDYVCCQLIANPHAGSSQICDGLGHARQYSDALGLEQDPEDSGHPQPHATGNLSGVNYLVRSASIILAGDWTLLFVLGFSS
jgi:hypothetical protein